MGKKLMLQNLSLLMDQYLYYLYVAVLFILKFSRLNWPSLNHFKSPIRLCQHVEWLMTLMSYWSTSEVCLLMQFVNELDKGNVIIIVHLIAYLEELPLVFFWDDYQLPTWITREGRLPLLKPVTLLINFKFLTWANEHICYSKSKSWLPKAKIT